MTDIFERAARNAYRYPSNKGSPSTEDLFNMSEKQLDIVFKYLRAEVKDKNDESLFDEVSTDDIHLNTKIAIVRYIAERKVKMREAANKAVQTRQEGELLDDIIARKERQDLENLSVEELKAKRAALTV